jgi:hypothetical protein
MDVAAWLRGLGLEEYAPAFRDNDVAIIRATASARRWRAVELLELFHESVVSGHSDLASLRRSGPQPKYNTHPHISSNPTART